MHTLTTTDTAELTAHLTRASKARREGVRLLRDRTDGRHYATSATTRGVVYYVTLVSCECPGFQHHGHCKHNSALVIAHALQDGHISPDPCHLCNGTGTVQEPRSRWVGGSKLGYRSTWVVDVPCEACADVEAHIAA